MTAPTDLAAALIADVPRYDHYDDDYEQREQGAWVTYASVLAALSRALDPALSERAGEVLEGVVWVIFDTAPNVNAPVGVSETNPGTMLDRYEAARYVRADLITALLAQNAALRAERDEMAVTAAGWQEMAKGNAERGAKIGNDLIARAEAAEATVATLTAQVEAMRGGAMEWQEKQRRDAFNRRYINAPEDPHVYVLCKRYGFGAVMDAASRLWAREDSMGAFYIGGCIGMNLAATLTTENHNV